MSSKRAKSKQGFEVNEPAAFVLSQLLFDFREQELTANDLRNGYKGLDISDIKARTAKEGFNEVDRDLAIEDLEFHGLIRTGPMVAHENRPWDTVIAIGLYSKHEYAYLSEQGYKEAISIPSAPQSRTKQAIAHMHFSGNTFNNSPIGVGGSVSQAINVQASTSSEAFMAFRIEVSKQIHNDAERENILSRLDELEESKQLPTKYEKYTMLMGAIGDHITVLGFLLPPILKWITG